MVARNPLDYNTQLPFQEHEAFYRRLKRQDVQDSDATSFQNTPDEDDEELLMMDLTQKTGGKTSPVELKGVLSPNYMKSIKSNAQANFFQMLKGEGSFIPVYQLSKTRFLVGCVEPKGVILIAPASQNLTPQKLRSIALDQEIKNKMLISFEELDHINESVLKISNFLNLCEQQEQAKVNQLATLSIEEVIKKKPGDILLSTNKIVGSKRGYLKMDVSVCKETFTPFVGFSFRENTGLYQGNPAHYRLVLNWSAFLLMIEQGVPLIKKAVDRFLQMQSDMEEKNVL